MEKQSNGNLSAQEILTYLDLVARKIELQSHHLDWQPEMADELEHINAEIAKMRELVDQERQRREQPQEQADAPEPMRVETLRHVYDDAVLHITRYAADGSLCLILYADGEPLATLTVCLADQCQLGKDFAFLDINNCPWAEDFVRKYRLGTDVGVALSSGYCVYPLYKFDMEQLAKYI